MGLGFLQHSEPGSGVALAQHASKRFVYFTSDRKTVQHEKTLS